MHPPSLLTSVTVVNDGSARNTNFRKKGGTCGCDFAHNCGGGAGNQAGYTSYQRLKCA